MSPTGRRGSGFTLVELLVVVGIIAILIALLLPALSSARRSANDVACASNIRQVCTALTAYAAQWKNRFPPNGNWGSTSDPAGLFAEWWSDEERIGPFLSGVTFNQTWAPLKSLENAQGATGAVAGVLVCPEDEGAARSYSMNRWVGPLRPTNRTTVGGVAVALGGPTMPEASKTILVTETYSTLPTPYGYAAFPTVGASGWITPGERFGATLGRRYWGDPGEPVRYPMTRLEINYMNHRRRADGGEGPLDPRGRVNIGYVDGHVEMKRFFQLVDEATGVTRLDTLWHPSDRVPQSGAGAGTPWLSP